MTYQAAPSDSRYIPLTQQAACCVPTCIQMVMYKEGISLLPAEEIGYHLGLTVHPDRKSLFYNVRTADKAPPAGYGTQIYDPQFEPNAVFNRLSVPLSFNITPISSITNVDMLVQTLTEIETMNVNALLCFNHGELLEDSAVNWGHVCVFDRIIDKKIRIIDPSPDQPKWQLIEPEHLYTAMRAHGDENSAGVWLLSKTSSI